MIKFHPYVKTILENSIFSKEYLAKRKKELDAGDYNYKYNASVINAINKNNEAISRSIDKRLKNNGIQEWQIKPKPY